jgi:drug/metabolite transporter (DMT)-like permease
MNLNKNAYFYVFLSIILWSTVASAFKLTLRELDFARMLFWASASSLIVLFAVLVRQRKLKDLWSQSVGQIIRSAGMGFINPFLYYTILFKAYSLLPAQEAQPLNWTWPLTLSILSCIFLNQRLKRRALLGILVSFSGVLIIFTGGNLTALKFSNLSGDILAVSSSLFWAGYWVLNLRDRRDAVVKLFSGFLFGVIYSGVGMLIFSQFEFPDLKGILGSVYIGLFEMGITFIIWLKALELAGDNIKVGTYAYLTPFISLIFIHYVVGEAIKITSICGLILIIAGILIATPGSYSQRPNRAQRLK